MRTGRINEITIASDWVTTVGTAAGLIVAGVLASSEIRQLVSGKAAERVSLNTIIVAFYCLVFVFSFRAKLLKFAFALIGIQAAGRIILSYMHASSGFRHVAAVSGPILNLVGLIIVIFAIVKWFRAVIHKSSPLKPEEPTS
jgi:hypothetical protein